MSNDAGDQSEQMKLAREHVKARRFPEAIQVFNIIGGTVSDPELLYAWGAALHGNGNPRAAVAKFCAALRKDPEHFASRNALGWMLAELKHYKWAIRELDTAIKQNLKHPISLINKASALAKSRHHEEALTVYESAINADFSLFPTDEERIHARAVLYYDWGNSLAALSQLSSAREKYLSATELKRDFFYAIHNHAYYSWAEGFYRQARLDWARARRVARQQHETQRVNNNATYFSLLGYAQFYISRDYAEAETTLKMAYDIDPENTQVLGNLMYLHLEQRESASPTYAAQHHWRATSYYNQAIKILQKRGRTGSPSTASTAWVRLAQFHIAMGDVDRAIDALSTATTLDPDTPRLDYAWGQAYQRNGEYAKALPHLKRAIQNSAVDRLAARNELAECLRRLGRLEEAERELSETLQLTPYFLPCRFTLGRVYLEQGRDNSEFYLEQAIQQFSEIVLHDGSDYASRSLMHFEIAELHYLRAVARVKLFTAMKGPHTRVSLLSSAFADLDEALRHDPRHVQAKYGRERLNRYLAGGGGTGRLASVAPWTITLLALWIFGVAQALFFGAFSGRRISMSEYLGLSFGALMFLIAGVLLPFLLKLKFASIELEIDRNAARAGDDFSWLNRAVAPLIRPEFITAGVQVG